MHAGGVQRSTWQPLSSAESSFASSSRSHAAASISGGMFFAASSGSGDASYAVAGAGALPPGWVAQLDPRSGAPYYTNLQTGVAQWVPPPDAAIAPPPSPFAALAPPAAPPLPSGWVAAADPTSGHTYYCNAVRQPA